MFRRLDSGGGEDLKLARTSITALLAAVCVLSAHAALAQGESEQQAEFRLAERDYARGGYYFGAEGLVSVENSPVVGGSAFLVSGGVDLRLGFRHNRWLATELSGIYVHTYGGTNILAWGMSVNERVYFSKSRFQPFVTVGMGFLQLRSRNTSATAGISSFSPSFSMLFGLGMEIYATEDMAVTVMANYNMPIASGVLSDFLAVGLAQGGSTNFDFVTAGIGMVFF